MLLYRHETRLKSDSSRKIGCNPNAPIVPKDGAHRETMQEADREEKRGEQRRKRRGRAEDEMIGVGAEHVVIHLAGFAQRKTQTQESAERGASAHGAVALVARVGKGVVDGRERDKVRQRGLRWGEREARRAAGLLGRSRGARPREGWWLGGVIEAARR